VAVASTNYQLIINQDRAVTVSSAWFLAHDNVVAVMKWTQEL
jgi:hypothetical protein